MNISVVRNIYHEHLGQNKQKRKILESIKTAEVYL